MATYRIVERRAVTGHSVLCEPTIRLHYYVQKRWWLFGWFDETYVSAGLGGDLGTTRKHWFDTFEEARQHILGTMPDNSTKETIIVQYLNV